MSIYEAIVNLIGDVPIGLEPVAWVISSVVLLYLISCTYSIIYSIINYMSVKVR